MLLSSPTAAFGTIWSLFGACGSAFRLYVLWYAVSEVTNVWISKVMSPSGGTEQILSSQKQITSVSLVGCVYKTKDQFSFTAQ